MELSEVGDRGRRTQVCIGSMGHWMHRTCLYSCTLGYSINRSSLLNWFFLYTIKYWGNLLLKIISASVNYTSQSTYLSADTSFVVWLSISLCWNHGRSPHRISSPLRSVHLFSLQWSSRWHSLSNNFPPLVLKRKAEQWMILCAELRPECKMLVFFLWNPS